MVATRREESLLQYAFSTLEDRDRMIVQFVFVSLPSWVVVVLLFAMSDLFPLKSFFVWWIHQACNEIIFHRHHTRHFLYVVLVQHGVARVHAWWALAWPGLPLALPLEASMHVHIETRKLFPAFPSELLCNYCQVLVCVHSMVLFSILVL